MSEYVLELKGITKIFPGVRALDKVQFQLKPGEIHALMGENGAGKTTLLKCILGLLSYEGEILLDGEKIHRGNIGRLSFATCEHSFFPNLTPISHRDFYQMHFGCFRDKRFKALMDFFLFFFKTAVKNFSVG